MALPKEPRQKMINLMYLVLTAMLALNVSAEILTAFRTVNESIGKSNQSIVEKNSVTYKQFEERVKADAATVQPIKEKADQVRKLSDEVFTAVENLKTQLLQASGLDATTGEYKEDNIDAATRLMETEKKGAALEQQLTAYKTALLQFVDEKDRENFSKNLPLDLTVPKTQNKENKTWSSSYFRMTPTIAAVTILSKFQNDIRNSESAVADYLFDKIGQDKIIYDRIEPFVAANSNYLLSGQPYEATIGIGAISSSVNPTIRVNGAVVPVNGGVGLYKETAGGVGTKTLNVEIDIRKANGQIETVRKQIEYTVGMPTGAVVMADKMNVLYIGVDNPMTVSAGSTGDEKVSVSLAGGTISKKGNGKYVARVTTPGETKITVSADGKSTAFPFRVKRIPDPRAQIGNLEPGKVAATTLRAQLGIRALLENFDFEAYFTVSSFRLSAAGGGLEDLQEAVCTGPSFSSQAQTILGRCKAGTIVTIDEIKVVGPDGSSRKLPTISYVCR